MKNEMETTKKCIIVLVNDQIDRYYRVMTHDRDLVLKCFLVTKERTDSETLAIAIDFAKSFNDNGCAIAEQVISY